MRLNKYVCLTTYFNAFDRKMAYELRDKAPRTLRDSYKVVVNIENNRKASGKMGRREGLKNFNSKNILPKLSEHVARPDRNTHDCTFQMNKYQTFKPWLQIKS